MSQTSGQASTHQISRHSVDAGPRPEERPADDREQLAPPCAAACPPPTVGALEVEQRPEQDEVDDARHGDAGHRREPDHPPRGPVPERVARQQRRCDRDQRVALHGEVGDEVPSRSTSRSGSVVVEHPAALDDQRQLQDQRTDRDDGGQPVPDPRAPDRRRSQPRVRPVPDLNEFGQPVGDRVPEWSPRPRPDAGHPRGAVRRRRAARRYARGRPARARCAARRTGRCGPTGRPSRRRTSTR